MKEYSRDSMLSVVEEYFSKHGYKVNEYSDDYDIRVPLYCEPTNREKEDDDVVVDLTTSREITKETFFVPKRVKTRKKNGKYEFRDIIFSPLLFYQHYFPNAKVFYAIADYAIPDDATACIRARTCKGFAEFVSYCEEQKIGLIKVYGKNKKSKTEEPAAKEILPSTSLSKRFSEELISLCKEYEKEAENQEEDKQDIGESKKTESEKTLEKINKTTNQYLHGALDYLVYYPHPEYKRRSIASRIKKDEGVPTQLISLFLVEKMEELEKIEFLKELQEFSDTYRHAKESDYDIASRYVNSLWKTYLNLDYPPAKIQERFEEIFFTDPRYREHFVHQFQVFLLGSFIIDKLYSSKKAIFDDFHKENGDSLEKAWLAASTYHDYNYSTQKYGDWLGKYLENVLQLSEKGESKKELSRLNLEMAAVRENFLFTSEKIMKCNIDSKQSTETKEKLNLFLFEKIVSERNHGLISSLTLLKRHRTTKRTKITKKSIEQAALAIALHDENMWEYFCGCRGFLLGRPKNCNACPKKSGCKDWGKAMMKCRILKKIDFTTYPLLYLLILCDSCQDEGRVTNLKGIKSSIRDIKVGADGGVTIEIEAIDENPRAGDSYESKSAEFECLREFLKDGNFKVILRSKGKETLEYIF